MLSDMWSKTTTCLNPALLDLLILLFEMVVKFFFEMCFLLKHRGEGHENEHYRVDVSLTG
jgi:hypothetical protein